VYYLPPILLFFTHDFMQYEHLIMSMKTKNLDMYFVQETWLKGNVFDEVINGYHVFRHNGDLCNHNFCRVAIILSPQYYEGWKAAGATPPITTDKMGKFLGRYISITVKLDSHDKRGKLVQGKKGDKLMTLSLASIYHSCTKTGSDNVYMRFLDTLDGLLDKLPKSELIIGADINANIGRFNNMSAAEFGPAIGPHGFPKRNSKGESLLAVYLAHCLRVMNTFFPGKANGPGHGTWTSNQPTSNGQAELHMLDVIVTSTTLHKRVKNCFVAPDGINSDH
jgi:exonuclease III